MADYQLLALETDGNFTGRSDNFVEIQVASSAQATDLLAADLRTLRKDGIDVRDATFAKQKAYTDDVVGAGFHSRDFLFVHGDVYYRITATCPEADWPTKGRKLLDMVRSFTFVQLP
jgi:hypothetical protein